MYSTSGSFSFISIYFSYQRQNHGARWTYNLPTGENNEFIIPSLPQIISDEFTDYNLLRYGHEMYDIEGIDDYQDFLKKIENTNDGLQGVRDLKINKTILNYTNL
ncbi:hypothetical protein [Fulvivirga ligni]|uniref:hypothetical protein n=1 Tax=Fulvivirga ligni TaxID=2904246 RepID=UPI001F3A485E|nr:hypothetical protein [Fulvivirga ligni]UII19140.1 hypothetical protein LVD16_14945 [Fulvivirga ligni]